MVVVVCVCVCVCVHANSCVSMDMGGKFKCQPLPNTLPETDSLLFTVAGPKLVCL